MYRQTDRTSVPLAGTIRRSCSCMNPKKVPLLALLLLSAGPSGKLVVVPQWVTCFMSAVFLSEFRSQGVKLSMSPPVPEVPIGGRGIGPSHPISPLC